MISIREINEKDIDLCYELDLNTISFWSKRQCESEFKKEGVKVFGLLVNNLIVGLCVSQVVLDEAHINYFAVAHKFRKNGFGSHLMNNLIKYCQKINVNKLFLEVSERNTIAQKFYDHFEFSTLGIRRNYYKDGSAALLKEKKLRTK